jgi:hypothetical protein
METRYIKLDPEEAIFLKKELLSSELDFLHLIKKIRMYKISRDEEFLGKYNLKTDITTIRTKINLIILSLPRIEGFPDFLKPKEEKIDRFDLEQTNKKIEDKIKKHKKKEESDLNEELEKTISKKREFIPDKGKKQNIIERIIKGKNTQQPKIEPKKNKIVAPKEEKIKMSKEDEEKMKSNQDEIEEINAQLRKLEG